MRTRANQRPKWTAADRTRHRRPGFDLRSALGRLIPPGDLIMGRHLVFVAVTLTAAAPATGAAQPPKASPPRIFLSNPADLARAKDRLAAGDQEVVAIAADLRNPADKDLKPAPFPRATPN